MPTPNKTGSTVEEKLDIIIEHLEKMDHRDRMRMVGGYFRFIVALIPVILLLWSVWYTIAHGPELLKMISDEAASSAAKFTQDQSSSFYQQMMDQVQKR